MSRYSQEEIDQSRQAIEKAAARLFRLKGYHGVGLSEITKAAGLTNGTFYAHFPSKRALFEAVVENALARRSGIFESLRAKESFERIHHFVEFYLGIPHYEEETRGCIMPRLAGDLKEHRLEKFNSPKRYINAFTSFLSEAGLDPTESQFITASLVGTLVTARTLPHKEGLQFLENSKKTLIRYIKQKLKETEND